jgi:glucosylceramidase
MKTNNQMNGGGKLRPEYAQAWADYFVRYVQEYHKQGVDIWGLTVQNEPAASQSWDSCEYTAQEETDFVRDHLGPTLAKAGMTNIKLMVWDHNRDIMMERLAVPYSDPEAGKYIWGAGIHWYSAESFNNMTLIHDAWPDKAILFTEGCQEGRPKDGDWRPGERYGHNILNDLNHWAVGWTDWNMVLDQTGGPNHSGNLCNAPILADTTNDKVMIQPSYYYMGHFSKFIKPGAKRVLCWLLQDKIEAAAFQNPDKSDVIVVLNRDDQPQHFLLATLKANAPQIIPPHSIATYVVTQ